MAEEAAKAAEAAGGTEEEAEGLGGVAEAAEGTAEVTKTCGKEADAGDAAAAAAGPPARRPRAAGESLGQLDSEYSALVPTPRTLSWPILDTYSDRRIGGLSGPLKT